jgi:hypothetical protein
MMLFNCCSGRGFKKAKTYSNHYTYGDKLFGDLGGIIIGFSGSKNTFELFRTDIVGYVNDYQKTYNEGVSLHKIILQISEISYRLSNRYRGEDESFDILLATSGTKLPTLHSSLRYFYQDGKLETVMDYKAIGTASPYGLIYLKHNWYPQITMNEGASLGHFIIKFIETFQLDLSVGTGTSDAQVWFIPHSSNDFQATPKILEDLNALTNKKIDDFRRQNMAKII